MNRRMKERYLALLFAGLTAGAVLVQLGKEQVLPGIFGSYFLSQYAVMQIDMIKLLRWIGEYRMGQYLLVVCCGTIPMASLALGILIVILGMSIGTMLSISTVELGIRGILLCAVGMLPQLFFYLPAFGWVILWVENQGRNRKKYGFLIAAGAIFLLFGILCETWINPILIQQILRKMS